MWFLVVVRVLIWGNRALWQRLLVSRLSVSYLIFSRRVGSIDPSARFWTAILWPRIPHLSVSIPAWLAHWCVAYICGGRATELTRRVEVAKPTEFGMPNYEDLRLTTSDNVKLQCYLMRQKRITDDSTLNDSSYDSEDAVSSNLHQRVLSKP